MAKRILIADDSVTIQRAFAMTFAAEDVGLLAARSADEGLSIARQARPDLVIADAAMPGRSGYDLCAAVKSDPGLRGVPVYILSSSQNAYDELRARQSGADGNLIKPFDSNVLIERVREAINRGTNISLGGAGSTSAGMPAATSSTASTPLRATMSSLVAAAARPAPMSRPGDDDEDDYGEITIEAAPGAREPARPGIVTSPLAPLSAPAPAVAAPPGRLTGPVPTTAPGGGLRPSLIPGLRPGTMPAARPGTQPLQPAAAAPLAPAARAPAPLTQTGMGAPAPARPAVGMPSPIAPQPAAARSGVTAAPPYAPAARPGTAPVRPLAPSAPVAAAVTSAIDQKVAAFAARGPEYEAIAKLSREIIEKVVWEVVPELAEAIVREELQKRGRI
jgi:CheY-like chemotaxis protein